MKKTNSSQTVASNAVSHAKTSISECDAPVIHGKTPVTHEGINKRTVEAKISLKAARRAIPLCFMDSA